MQVLTDVGQFTAVVDGKSYCFTPSFSAMARLAKDSLTRLTDVFVTIHGGKFPKINNPDIAKQVEPVCFARMAMACKEVMEVCCNENISNLIGSLSINRKGWLSYRAGYIELEDIIKLARHLMRHGIMGDQKPDEDEEPQGKFTNEFDPRVYVYLAVAHLGISEQEAWGMTMTGFRAAMEAKFPRSEKDKIPSNKRYEEAMDWADKIIMRDNAR
ncbi:DUF6246 family protein [Providencia rettgeri]|uniref:DUF6246 family protein n=1 Tax=Providencia rettgeri TaxID=587 RepID=UPI001B3713FE|nr:DUF6246 family protein [Providencia rettgeri]ELR5030214.1 hypothetical protein [Providencia rettgeri]ELR5161871.1 hypothetical protein [Providencia rettgeri]MBQ0361268.1 hypothetical protein [Providencia rettgeri]MBQ0664857.1 hypothetical protein [Providencia rettgeri]MCB4826678.1 DUF6246 family protein [Providencia rettgeri]